MEVKALVEACVTKRELDANQVLKLCKSVERLQDSEQLDVVTQLTLHLKKQVLSFNKNKQSNETIVKNSFILIYNILKDADPFAISSKKKILKDYITFFINKDIAKEQADTLASLLALSETSSQNSSFRHTESSRSQRRTRTPHDRGLNILPEGSEQPHVEDMYSLAIPDYIFRTIATNKDEAPSAYSLAIIELVKDIYKRYKCLQKFDTQSYLSILTRLEEDLEIIASNSVTEPQQAPLKKCTIQPIAEHLHYVELTEKDELVDTAVTLMLNSSTSHLAINECTSLILSNLIVKPAMDGQCETLRGNFLMLRALVEMMLNHNSAKMSKRVIRLAADVVSFSAILKTVDSEVIGTFMDLAVSLAIYVINSVLMTNGIDADIYRLLNGLVFLTMHNNRSFAIKDLDIETLLALIASGAPKCYDLYVLVNGLLQKLYPRDGCAEGRVLDNTLYNSIRTGAFMKLLDATSDSVARFALILPIVDHLLVALCNMETV